MEALTTTRSETLSFLNVRFMQTGKAFDMGRDCGASVARSFCLSHRGNLLFLSQDPLRSSWALIPQVLVLHCPNLCLVV